MVCQLLVRDVNDSLGVLSIEEESIALPRPITIITPRANILETQYWQKIFFSSFPKEMTHFSRFDAVLYLPPIAKPRTVDSECVVYCDVDLNEETRKQLLEETIGLCFTRKGAITILLGIAQRLDLTNKKRNEGDFYWRMLKREEIGEYFRIDNEYC